MSISIFTYSLHAKRIALALAITLFPAIGVLTAFGIAPDTSLADHHLRVVEENVSLQPIVSNAKDSEELQRQDRVQRGDSVGLLLSRLGVQDPYAFNALRTSREAAPLFRNLRPGKPIHASTSMEGELKSLRYFFAPDKMLEVARSPNGFEVMERAYAEQIQRTHKSGEIRSSLFASTDEAGIPDTIAIQIARIFSTDIDFHVDLRRGDRYAVVYDMVYADGELVRAGEVIYAEFVNNGRTYEAFRFQDPDGNISYYSRDGQNRAKSFLRSPLEFSRVSSGFGGRVHPIFKNWRAHTGVDFAAPKGTRIWATADGTIEFAGVKGGYGNCIEIRHSGGITTLYAHLSGFANGIRRGVRVRQGEPIGFVGATGYATGPHLHYEFKVSGIHQDPMKVALPKANPLPAAFKPAFESVAATGSESLLALRSARSAAFE
ncbi:MAG: M23 family metallopeptidase [Burkholderiales bacterium]|nr:M23 family metallopeptidase [Burkholderiales bacterium]